MSTGLVLLRQLFLEWHRTLSAAADAIDDEEFLGKRDAEVPMFWTLLHLTGLLEWVSGLITGLPTTAPVEILDQFKGGDDENPPIGAHLPLSRNEVHQLFSRAGERVAKIFDEIGDEALTRPVEDPLVAVQFPTIGDLLACVCSQGHYHLGQMSLGTATLRNFPDLALPTQFKDGRLLRE